MSANLDKLINKICVKYMLHSTRKKNVDEATFVTSVTWFNLLLSLSPFFFLLLCFLINLVDLSVNVFENGLFQ